MTTLEKVLAVVTFVFGKVWTFEELPDNAIGLDGATQGPKLDPKKRKYSFDHHADCIRMVTLATCQQVSTALQLGLVVDDGTRLYVNDLDADTVLSVWLLLNAQRINEPRVAELVNRIGLTDAHGPVYAAHPMHTQIQLPYGSKETQTHEMLASWLDKLTAYADGTYEPPVSAPQLSNGYGWNPQRGWETFQNLDGYGDYLMRIVYWQQNGDTYGYLVGKKSDLVPVEVGPSNTKRPATSRDDYLPTLLGMLGLSELDKNSEQSHANNWGGGSSVGGSPRNADNKGSCLTPEEVLALAKRFTK